MKPVITAFLVLFGISAVHGQFARIWLRTEDTFSTEVRVEKTTDAIPRTYAIGKINGVEYRYFHDNARGVVEGSKGSGTEPIKGSHDPKKWEFRCQRLEGSVQNQCGFSKQGIAIITYSVGKDFRTWIAATNFPFGDGTLPEYADTIEVDGVTVYNSRNKEFSPDALTLMRTGKLLTLRRGSTPEGVTTYDLYGFSEALALSAWAVQLLQ